jgi:hypothetical protein
VSALSASALDYSTNDQIDSIISLPRTGDIRISLNGFVPYGWVTMNDGTIGNASSNSSTRANIDTFPLFNLLWRAFQANQTLAPMLTSASAPVAYGADPFTDFAANRQLTLTVQAGRVIAGVNGSHALGTATGAETHTILAGELPSVVDGTITTQSISLTPGGTPVLSLAGIAGAPSAVRFGLGSNTPMNIIQPTVYNNIYIKL